MDALTRNAVIAYLRLLATLPLAVLDPDNFEEALSAAAWQANAAMKEAGVLHMPLETWTVLVREAFPDLPRPTAADPAVADTAQPGH
ncbi:hypothetical protein ABT224_36250 [Streptomyces sp. NPDC001584]|uniref:hypothetical protein n=1 Tax=Streptomyces sp. NPDC001584 TaxID=3154521 RepID=UPI00331A98CE